MTLEYTPTTLADFERFIHLPENSDRDSMRVKVAAYLAAGTTLWVIDPEKKRVEILAPGTPPLVLTVNDTVRGGDVLPGFAVPISVLFASKS